MSLIPDDSRLPGRHALARAAGASTVPAGLARAVAVLSVGAFGAAALGVGSTAPAGLTRGAHASAAPGTHRLVASASTAPVASRPEAAPLRRPAPPAASTDAAPAAAPRKPIAASAHQVAAAKPWVPTGTGMWIYQWEHTSGGSATRMVSRARHVGLSTLYLRTGSSWDGFTGGSRLSALLRAARGTDVHVVAWDFPQLRHPQRDARRLAQAARVGRGPHGGGVSAVAPDIETPAEGTFNASWRVHAYLTTLRRHLPKGVTILTAVPWPSRYRIADYPYRTVAGGSDVLIPMAYWYNNPPALVTARSISYLRRFHRPVQPVGQGYDGKADVPSLRHNHLRKEVPTFFRTAHRFGANAVSVWSWQSAPPATWRALSKAHGLFRGR